MEFLIDIWNFFNIAPHCDLAFWPLLAGLIGGAVKHVAVDKPMADKQRQLAAETQRYSPWTDLKAGAVEEPSLFGSLLQGGTTGLSLGQGLEDVASKAGITDAMKKNIEAQTAALKPPTVPLPGSGMGGMSSGTPWQGMLMKPTYGMFDYSKYNLG